MFSGASSFAERLRAAAQAGVEQFDQARVHAPDLHLPKINLPIGGASSPVQGTSSPSATPLSPGAVDNARRLASGLTSPRRSGELERTVSTGSAHSALSSRLNSLVAGATKGRNSNKTTTARGASLDTASFAESTGTAEPKSTVPGPQASSQITEPIDPANIPLPPSPEIVPFVLTGTSTPDPTTTGQATPTAPSGLSLFNTPRNPLPSSPSTALSIQRPKTPSPLSSPVMGPTVFADQAEKGDAVPEVQVENEDVTKVKLDPDVSHGQAGEQEAVDAETDVVTSAGTVEDSQMQPNSELQVLKATVNKANEILRGASPLLTDGIADADALESWVKMVGGKLQMGDSEMKRIGDKLALQESRIQELRETHRMESESSNKLVASLRDQVAKAESALSSQASQLLQMTQVQNELKIAQARAREEEEKRGKAVALLKTVRTKLVKIEREKEEVDKRQEEEKAERQRLFENLERLRTERDRETQNLRQSHERDMTALKERYEKEMLAKRREWELEMITTKASHAKDMAAKTKQINSMVESMQELNNEKRTQFETLQARQEELETAIAAKEMHEARTRELQLQAQEALERAQIAEDALEEMQREQSNSNMDDGFRTDNSPGSGEIARLVAEATAKSEAKLAELKDEISRLERESVESEEQQARQLRLRSQEIERLRTTLNEKQAEFALAISSKETSDAKISELERELEAATTESNSLRIALRDAQAAHMQLGSGEEELKAEIDLLRNQIDGLNSQLEEAHQIHAQLRSANRTLREEMRRIQSSAQLLERQRNPGVGYWSSTNATSTPFAGTPGGVTSPGGASSPTMSVRGSVDAQRAEVTPPVNSGAATPKAQDEEEVNLEYLRNVILQFLEHKEMRPNLVRVLSVILRFTPQEARRLNAKLNA